MPSATQEDDIVEFLEDDDVPDGQLRFDMSAMNFGSSLNPPTAKKSSAGTKPTISTSGTPLLSANRSGMSTPVESAPPSGVSTPSRAATKLGKRIDVVTEYQKRVAEKESLNLVVIGRTEYGLRIFHPALA